MRRIMCCVLTLLLLCSVCPLAIAGAAGDILQVYPEYDSRILRCYDYTVNVTQGENTQALTVYNQNTTVELLTSRTRATDNNRRFCEFAFSGSRVRVDIKVNFDFSSYSVLPSAKAFETSYSNGVISVYLDSPDEYFLLELDGDYNTILSVFADAPENYDFSPDDAATLVIDEKWYMPDSGVLTIPNTIKTFYIAPGSVLCARVLAKSTGLRVIGHGIVLDPWSNIFETYTGMSHFFALNASDITVKDIKLLDAQSFNICMYSNADRAVIENVKALSIRMCTDGISVYGADNVTVKHCFVYVGDNAIVFEGGNSNVFSDCCLGTTCAAIFPQKALPNETVFNNTYVFRCDQGAVNHWHNPDKLQQPVSSLIFNGFDCVDVLNFPWLFYARNMGTAEKKY